MDKNESFLFRTWHFSALCLCIKKLYMYLIYILCIENSFWHANIVSRCVMIGAERKKRIYIYFFVKWKKKTHQKKIFLPSSKFHFTFLRIEFILSFLFSLHLISKLKKSYNFNGKLTEFTEYELRIKIRHSTKLFGGGFCGIVPSCMHLVCGRTIIDPKIYIRVWYTPKQIVYYIHNNFCFSQRRNLTKVMFS